jgi:hypothetical protein
MWHQRTVNFGVVKKIAIEQLFGTWEISYTLLPQILGAIAQTTPGTKFKISTCDTSDDNIKMFKSID